MNIQLGQLSYAKIIRESSILTSFVQRYSVHLQLSFNPGRALALMDSISGLIASEVPAMRRWSKSMRLGNDMDWEKHLKVMRDFLSQRPKRTGTRKFFRNRTVT